MMMKSAATTRHHVKHCPPLFCLFISLIVGSIGYLIGSTTHIHAQLLCEQYADLLEQKLETTKSKSTTTTTTATTPSEFLETEKGSSMNTFAYVFYATQSNYYCGALVNAYQLIHLGKDPNIDIVILTTADFQPSPQHLETAKKTLKIKHLTIMEMLPLGEFDNPSSSFFSGYYADSMAKLSVFSLYKQGYTRIIFLDSDSLVLKCLDEFFYLPSVSLAAPRAYWIDPGLLKENCGSATWRPDDGSEVGLQQKFSSAFMVIEPSQLVWERLQAKYWPDGEANFRNMFDMDLLNIEFKDEVMLLPGSQILRLSTDWGPDGRRANRHLPGNEEALDEDFFNSTYVLHFTWGGKVWSISTELFEIGNPTAHPFAKRIWSTWWKIGGVDGGIVRCAQTGPGGLAAIELPAKVEGNTFTTVPVD
jgi:alpha-N-acetylglucosamine transferase